METGRRLLREAEAEAAGAAGDADGGSALADGAGQQQRAARLADRLRLLRVSLPAGFFPFECPFSTPSLTAAECELSSSFYWFDDLFATNLSRKHCRGSSCTLAKNNTFYRIISLISTVRRF